MNFHQTGIVTNANGKWRGANADGSRLEIRIGRIVTAAGSRLERRIKRAVTADGSRLQREMEILFSPFDKGKGEKNLY